MHTYICSYIHTGYICTRHSFLTYIWRYLWAKLGPWCKLLHGYFMISQGIFQFILSFPFHKNMWCLYERNLCAKGKVEYFVHNHNKIQILLPGCLFFLLTWLPLLLDRLYSSQPSLRRTPCPHFHLLKSIHSNKRSL